MQCSYTETSATERGADEKDFTRHEPREQYNEQHEYELEVYEESLEPSCARLERLQQERELIETRMVLRKARKNAMTEVGMREHLAPHGRVLRYLRKRVREERGVIGQEVNAGLRASEVLGLRDRREWEACRASLGRFPAMEKETGQKRG
jgi:hypothetical protein